MMSESMSNTYDDDYRMSITEQWIIMSDINN